MLSLICIKFRGVIEKGRMAQALGWVNRLHDNVLNYWPDCCGVGSWSVMALQIPLEPSTTYPLIPNFPLHLFDLYSIYRQKRIDSPDSSFLVWRFDKMRYEARFERSDGTKSWLLPEI